MAQDLTKLEGGKPNFKTIVINIGQMNVDEMPSMSSAHIDAPSSFTPEVAVVHYNESDKPTATMGLLSIDEGWKWVSNKCFVGYIVPGFLWMVSLGS